jgi:hypothetical protein
VQALAVDLIGAGDGGGWGQERSQTKDGTRGGEPGGSAARLVSGPGRGRERPVQAGVRAGLW